MLTAIEGRKRMAREMCPYCREIRNMRVSVSVKTEKGRDGKTRRIRTLTFHCEGCSNFVRSVDEDLASLERGN
jgi:hypothetical protein